jgi:oligopeptidase B
MSVQICDRTLLPAPESRPPQANHHGEATDPYNWLGAREDPRVRSCIDQENVNTEYSLTDTDALRRQLYEEMLDRVDLNRATVPVSQGRYEYYSRNVENKAYPIHCRRLRQADSPEEVILDENVLAEGKAYFALEFLSVSSDQARCIFGVDTTGNERASLFVKELAHDKSVVAVPGAAAGVAWANDGQTFFSVRLDERNRPFQIVRHHLARGSITEELIFEERDEAFRLRLGRTESGQFIIVTSWAHDTTELRYLDANHPISPISLLHCRQTGVEASASHHGQDFYIITNENAPGKKILTAPISDPAASNKRVFLDARPGIEISYMHAFATHLVVCERRDGLAQFRIIDMYSGDDHLVALPEPVYSLVVVDHVGRGEGIVTEPKKRRVELPVVLGTFPWQPGHPHALRFAQEQADFLAKLILVLLADGRVGPPGFEARPSARTDGGAAREIRRDPRCR